MAWYSDGWQAYTEAIRRAYRRPVRTGRVGRPPLRVPEGLSLTQTIKHRDERGRLLEVDRRPPSAPPPPPCSSRFRCIYGSMGCSGTGGPWRRARRTRLPRAPRRDALFGLSVFEHNWLRDHPALRGPSPTAGRRYERRTPAMEVGLTDHRWSWREFLTTKLTISY